MWMIMTPKTCLSINPPLSHYPGGRIILACRDTVKADVARAEIVERSGNQDVVIRTLDLSDTKSIREFAQVINRGRVTGLVIHEIKHLIKNEINNYLSRHES